MVLGVLQQGPQALQFMLSVLISMFSVPMSIFTMAYAYFCPPAPVAAGAKVRLLHTPSPPLPCTSHSSRRRS